MKDYTNHTVIHKNFGKGKVLSFYEKDNRTVLIIKFDALDNERHVFSDFYGMRIF